MAGRFPAAPGQRRHVRFRPQVGNGQIIAVSEAYESTTSARNGIQSVKTNAPDAAVDDQT